MFTNQYIDIWKCSDNRTAITIRNKPFLANQVNELTGYYPTNRDMKRLSKQDEPVFKLTAAQLNHVAANSEYLGKILCQIGLVG